MSISMNNIKTGQKANLLYNNEQVEVKFLGFTKIDVKYSKEPKFDTLKEVKKFYKVKRNSQLEDEITADMEYGHDVYGVFEEMYNGVLSKFTVYLCKGRWAICSGAYSFTLAELGE